VAHYHATVASQLGTDETFDYMAMFSNAAQWDPGTLAAEQLDRGPLRVGTRFRLTVSFLGRRLPVTYRITHYRPHREVALHAAAGLLRLADRIVVTAEGDGARVSYDAEVTLRRPLGLLDPVLSRGFAKVGERAAAGLARALSGSPAAPRPSPGLSDPGWDRGR
jgi:dehydrogenase/reductase SDR family member 12